MNNITKKNAGGTAIILLLYFFAYYINRAPFVWKYIDRIVSVTNYATTSISIIIGIYLIKINIKAFRETKVNRLSSISNAIFFILGIAAVVYSLFMFMVIVAFRNGFNF